MVKVVQPEIPPEWVPLFEKIFRWFETRGIPIWARMWFQDARSNDQNKKVASKFPYAGTAWSALSAATKQLWNLAAYRAYNYYRGYRLFTANYIWRQRAGLSLPGTPDNTHQLFGLKMANAGGAANVYARRDDKDLVGQINLKFSYKKTEITPSETKAFKVTCTAYYFTSGGYATDIDTYSAPAGNRVWQTLNYSFGTAGREYFHFKIVFSIDGYDAIVYLDNVVLSDANGEFFREGWNTINYVEWEPKMLYRKTDWVFNPAYAKPNFEHEYLL